MQILKLLTNSNTLYEENNELLIYLISYVKLLQPMDRSNEALMIFQKTYDFEKNNNLRGETIPWYQKPTESQLYDMLHSTKFTPLIFLTHFYNYVSNLIHQWIHHHRRAILFFFCHTHKINEEIIHNHNILHLPFH